MRKVLKLFWNISTSNACAPSVFFFGQKGQIRNLRTKEPQGAESQRQKTSPVILRGPFLKNTWMFPKIGVGYPQIIHFNEFSIINHPFWGTPIFGNTHIDRNIRKVLYSLTSERGDKGTEKMLYIQWDSYQYTPVNKLFKTGRSIHWRSMDHDCQQGVFWKFNEIHAR